MAPELTAASSVISLALEEPDPEGEYGHVATDERGERVRSLQRDAPPERKLADHGADERPGFADHRKLSEQERQRQPSPAGTLNDLQGSAGVGKYSDDGPDADQGADGEEQIRPADPFLLGELGHFDARLAGHRGPQPGEQIFLVLEDGHSGGVQCRALQGAPGRSGPSPHPAPGRLRRLCARRPPARPSRPAPPPGHYRGDWPEPMRTRGGSFARKRPRRPG